MSLTSSVLKKLKALTRYEGFGNTDTLAERTLEAVVEGTDPL